MKAPSPALCRRVLVLCLAAVASGCGAGDSPSASTTQPPDTPVLSRDGVGSAVVGSSPQAVFDLLIPAFGEPDIDSGWINSDSPLYGRCPGALMRAIAWGSLYLFFVSNEALAPNGDAGLGELYSYSYGYDFDRNEGATDPRRLGLATASGIGVGSTRAALQLAYGPQLSESYNEAADTWTWVVDGAGEGRLRGLLSGPEESAEVVLIERSPGCEIN